MGRQPDGSFLVSSGQRIEGGSIAFTGRPIDLALHPASDVLRRPEQAERLPRPTPTGSATGPEVPLGGQRRVPRPGLVARRLAALRQHRPGATSRRSAYEGGRLTAAARIARPARGEPGATPSPAGWRSPATARGCSSPRPTATPSSRSTWRRTRGVREFPVQNLPFEPRLSEDERTLVVSNWGGRLPEPGERTAKSQDLDIVVDERGVAGLGDGQPDRPARPARPGTSRSASTRRRSPSPAAGPTSPTR